MTRFYFILLCKQHNWTSGTYSIEISTWSYENRVRKHFVIFLNFLCLIACLLCCLLMSFVFLACLMIRDLCRSGCRQNYYLTRPPSIFFPTHNSFFNTSDSYQFEIRGRLRLVSVLFSSLVLYIGHLEKSFPESIM